MTGPQLSRTASPTLDLAGSLKRATRLGMPTVSVDRAELQALADEVQDLRVLANAVRVWRLWYPLGTGAHADNLARRYDNLPVYPQPEEF